MSAEAAHIVQIALISAFGFLLALANLIERSVGKAVRLAIITRRSDTLPDAHESSAPAGAEVQHLSGQRPP